MNLSRLLHNLAILHLILSYRAAAYSPGPRWGQAVALVNDALFVHGGFYDPSNSYSYTAAPIIDDLLYLPLSSPFDLSSPPWVLVSSSSNSSTKPGPALAWHTLSPVNTTEILLFGGLPAVSSPTVLTLRADSAWLLNIFNRLVPSWWQAPMSWAGEPIRRIHHTATSTPKGLVIIVGGERADGSKLTFSDHYIFDIDRSSFILLPTSNAPLGITGHAAILLPDGRLLVFGGFDSSSGALVPFSTIWVLDTNTLTWSVLAIATGTLPNPRRAFAAVLIAGGKIVIHGGSDATFQTTYSDGWILDTSQNPATWVEVSSLTELGERRDHFGIPSGDEVMFGFGYGPSGPAPPTPVIWNPSDGSFPSTYNPPKPSSPASPTIPGPTQTLNPTDGNGNGPTGTFDPNNPSATPPLNGGDNNKSKKTAAIAIGTIFGVLGLIAGAVVAVYYVRRRRSIEEARFTMLNDDDPDSPHTAGGMFPTRFHDEKSPGEGDRWRPMRNWKLGGALTAVPVGVVGIAGTKRTGQRVDMLADEDTREFGTHDWRRRNNSSWSLMSFMRRNRSQEPSFGSYNSYANLGTGSPRREKSDPFSDGAALLQDEETGFIGAAAPGSGRDSHRPFNRRQISQASTLSSYSYTDPFADPIREQYTDFPASSSSRRPPAQPLSIQTVLPAVGEPQEPHVLSPVTEASRDSRSQSDFTSTQSSHSHSNNHDLALSPFDTGSRTSQTSYHNTRPSSLIDTMSSQQMRRSDSWWSRFSRTAFLDRRGSGSRHPGGMYDIRDPNPPPRLGAIEESQNSGSAGSGDSPGSKRSNSVKRALSRKGSRPYTAGHGKSMSSIRTADSEALERMASMNVTQRERTGSGSQRESSGSYESGFLEEGGAFPGVVHGVDMSFSSSSPTDMTSPEAAAVARVSAPPVVQPPPAVVSALHKHSLTPSPPLPAPPSSASSSSSSLASAGSGNRPIRSPSGTAVAARVKAYERRMSQAQDEAAPPSPKKRRKSSVSYGLVPRPSLYVANPDHRAGPSGDSAAS
ncbi:hypothetical protein V5O48_002940 [Marasmius crinis-equi]|uniref:Galactose oxidase n=1 Tax=Marasmius crinis-equi TaxID=585013 RepID=A0ABR3FV88_9AGAR